MAVNDPVLPRQALRVRVTAGGRIVIPAEVRRDLGLHEGEELLLARDDDGYRITTYRLAISRAKDLFSRIATPRHDVVDDFLADRTASATQEDREFTEHSDE